MWTWASTVTEPGQDELIVVVGPTASGKTAVALELARRWGGELVGADSVQVYRGFDIGSGKPTAEELDGVPHALIDVVDPDDPLDAARFVSMADEAIAQVRARGRVPIVCGGTYLWVKALLEGLAEAPKADVAVRDELARQADQQGLPAMHNRLRAVDPLTAERLHPNDRLRVLRALEVYQLTGRPLSELHEAHGFRSRRYVARKIGIRWSKEALDQRIATRVEGMLRAGWIGEVEALVGRGFGASRPMGAVGYREVLAYVEGRLPKEDLLREIVRSTRTFARRQRTWLAHAEVLWLEGGGSGVVG